MFHLRSPLGQYKLTFDKAKEACANEAASMATYNQLSYAQKVLPSWSAPSRQGLQGTGCSLFLTRGRPGLLPSWRGRRVLLEQWYQFITSVGHVLCLRHHASALLITLSILITPLEVGVIIPILQRGQMRL